MTVKRVTSSELRTNVKRVLNEIEYGDEQYIIEKFGEPSAAIISIEDFQFFQTINAIIEEAAKDRSAEILQDPSEGEMTQKSVAHRGTTQDGSDQIKVTQKELLQSMTDLLKNSKETPEAVKELFQSDLGYKILAMLQYLDAAVSRLEAQLEVDQPESIQASGQEVTGPYSTHWNQFIGAFANEDWERPEQGTLEAREAW
ncbi:MAG: type II toxin-antitoxin system Phd/YefM family antitoxin [Chloroflexota bacterium]